MALPAASAGLGLRRALVGALQDVPRDAIDFLECAPENWIGVGGRLGDAFASLAARHPITCHGLSLSLGGPAPLDNAFVDQVGAFLDRHAIADYSEHLSWCGDDGQLYELLPLPFTDAAVEHAAARIRDVQARLSRRIAIENVSYYVTPHRSLDEADFVNAVLDAADCDLLLDVNNVYVNASNHGYDARAFIAAMPTSRIVQYHVAGHADGDTMKIDTHGAPVIDAVWDLLDHAYALHGVRPTLLERDADFPILDVLLAEVQDIRDLQRRHA